MNRFLSLAAIGFLFVATATADPPLAPAPSTAAPALVGAAPMMSPAPILGSTVPAPMVNNTLVTPQRRMGLFGRLRARNTAPALTTSAAYTTMPTTTVSPAPGVPAPMPAATPMPMKEGASSGTPTGQSIVQTSGGTPPMATTSPMTTGPVMMNGPMTTGPVMMASGVMTTPEMVATPATPRRMGLLARLRARRGN